MPVGIPIDILSSITETVKNNIIATMTKGHNDKDNKHDDDDDDDDDDDAPVTQLFSAISRGFITLLITNRRGPTFRRRMAFEISRPKLQNSNR